RARPLRGALRLGTSGAACVPRYSLTLGAQAPLAYARAPGVHDGQRRHRARSTTGRRRPPLRFPHPDHRRADRRPLRDVLARIAQGMLKGGSRVETALATLFSSPTFNVIVLGIVLSIFPWYLAALKILAGVIMVLLISPWLARLAERPGWRRPAAEPAKLPGVGWFQPLESLLGTPHLRGEAAPAPRG